MASPEDDRLENFASREPSFSFIYFSGEVREFISSLLVNCGYSMISRTPFERLGFGQVTHLVATSDAQHNDIVYKAVYSVAHGTVLLDPEMVVGVANDAAITDFCAKHTVEALVAIWERVSETVIARHIAANGVRVDAILAGGQPQQEPRNAPPDLLAHPGPTTLKSFLAAGGAPVDEIFGIVSGLVLKLDETRMMPPTKN